MTGRLTVRNGNWNCIISYVDEFGRNKQKWIKTDLVERGNKKQAKKILNAELAKFAKELESKKLVNQVDNDILFVDWVEKYIEKKKNEITKVVYYGYKNRLKFIKSFFGNKLKLKDVTHEHIEAFYNYLKQERKNTNTTIKQYSIIIYPSLKEAYKNDFLTKNPADFIAPIRKEKVRHKYYNKEDLEKLFKIIKGHRVELALKVASYYGFRRSELLGLKWESVDFENKTITVENKVITIDNELIITDVLKTTSSYRVLPLIKEIKNELLLHKEKIEENKAFFGKAYNTKFLDFVFVDESGNLILPDYLTKSLRDIIKKHNLKKIRLHDLRHSCASLLLASGVSMKQVQEWLGHANFATTADVYTHLDFDSKIDSANKLAQILSFNKQEQQEKELQQEIEELTKQLMEKKKQLNKSDFEM